MENNSTTAWRRGFWSLIATQFQGAFSDNALKNLVLFLVVGMGLPESARERLAVVVGVLFSVPFILFSMAGGYLADRYSKRSVTIGTKVLEIVVMLVALAGLAAGDLKGQLVAVFLISSQAALFGPSKYGLLPELLPQEELSWGNGILELGTFAAIITGTMAAGLMAETFAGRQSWSGGILIGLAAIGLLSSFGISRVPAADASKTFRANVFADLSEQVGYARKDRVLFLAGLGNTYFWFLGALLQLNIIFYGVDMLHLGPRQNAYLQGALAIGIGVGSVAAGYVSAGKIEYGLIPFGSAGMTLFAIIAGIMRPRFGGFAVVLTLIGFAAGFFAVPINALIQHRPEPERKGSVLAAANLISFIGIFLGTASYYLLTAILHLDPSGVFLVSGALTLGGTVYVMMLLPDSALRLLNWVLTHSIYRMRVLGRENVPGNGGALLVSNHLSFVDAMLLSASIDRPIRFLMFSDIYEKPLIRPWARIARAIPISNKLQPREMIHALREAKNAITGGELVCIFAEGQMTRTGQLLPFQRGFEKIMQGINAPIIPANLDGLWGSIFSFERRRFFWKVPRQFPYPVTVSFGLPMAAESSPVDVRNAVQQLATEAFAYRKDRMKTIQATFVRTARRHPLRFAMADLREERLTYAASLVRVMFLGQRLKKICDGQTMVGVLLPPSIGCALVNLAALLAGKVPVNLNYTLSAEALASCAKQCGLTTVITSKIFLERVHVEVPGTALSIEDLVAAPRLSEKIGAIARAVAMPVRSQSLDDLATVIFSSGSTGDPKGVMLSHYNIVSNVEQLGQVFAFEKEDRILGVLPLFHSFGFTGTFALPLSLGVGVVYHASPLDAQKIGSLVRKHAVTFLLTTPTFLQTYSERCSPEDFGSIRYVLAGAEKLPERVAKAFEDRFGIRPFEGYGCTECSPAVAVNTPDFRAVGFYQTGAKRGRIGHPLPGVSVQVVDPDTFAPLATGKSGLLLVRGPNVMKGYLGRPDLTGQVLRDGWYNTGDMASLDEDGFVTITDRLSRFSKIGGEMVPHVKIEEKLHELAGIQEQAFAVTSIPDDKKGERIGVLHTLPEERLQECISRLPQSGLPNLWLPRANSFFRVEALPHLATGKLDLRQVRDLAVKFAER
jgi:acyl-[acyl-carrier-protein]-phospholipid O-acyltransferase/long-chain-fatty-acid--[acyl-carrier-protein] ligase